MCISTSCPQQSGCGAGTRGPFGQNILKHTYKLFYFVPCSYLHLTNQCHNSLFARFPCISVPSESWEPLVGLRSFWALDALFARVSVQSHRSDQLPLRHYQVVGPCAPSPSTHGVLVEVLVRLHGWGHRGRYQRCDDDQQTLSEGLSVQLLR